MQNSKAEKDWLALHEWRKRNEWYRAQRQRAAALWREWRGFEVLGHYPSDLRAQVRRARRFIKAHNLSMVDPLLVEVVDLGFFLRDANKVGARTRTLFARHRFPHPGPCPEKARKRA